MESQSVCRRASLDIGRITGWSCSLSSTGNRVRERRQGVQLEFSPKCMFLVWCHFYSCLCACVYDLFFVDQLDRS
ncbi:hypothetical protein SDJN02_01465, partial [Cucurbita argyrosperma subsp. argyrosperma]